MNLHPVWGPLYPLHPQFRHPCSSSKGCLHCTRTRSPARTHAAKRSIWVIKVMYYPPKWATQLEKGNKKPSIQQFPAKQNIFIISSSHDGKRDNFDFLPSTNVKVAQWKYGFIKKLHSTAKLNFLFLSIFAYLLEDCFLVTGSQLSQCFGVRNWVVSLTKTKA